MLLSHAKRSVLPLSSFMGQGQALEDLMSNQPLFQVTNHHGEACGALTIYEVLVTEVIEHFSEWLATSYKQDSALYSHKHPLVANLPAARASLPHICDLAHMHRIAIPRRHRYTEDTSW